MRDNQNVNTWRWIRVLVWVDYHTVFLRIDHLGSTVRLDVESSFNCILLQPVIHILPTTPPEVNGLVDYCRQLHKNWPGESARWWIVSPKVAPGAGEAWPEVRFNQFDANATSLEAALDQTREKVAVLHYVGYGYDHRGVPDFLPKGLEAWKAKGNKLVTMFHEIYASGPMWKSEFWLKKKQIRIAQELVDLSDRWVTSCVDWHTRLVVEFGADPNRGCMIPISSAIDPIHPIDPNVPWPFEEKKQIDIAIFGFDRTRMLSLRAHKNLLHMLADRGHIHRVALIGKAPSPSIEAEIDKMLAKAGVIGRTERLYDADAEDISNRLARCTLSFSYYPFGILSKSSAFAAYATHGAITLIPPDQQTGEGPFMVNDDTRPEICYMSLQTKPKDADTSIYLSSNVAAQFAAEVAKA